MHFIYRELDLLPYFFSQVGITFWVLATNFSSICENLYKLQQFIYIYYTIHKRRAFILGLTNLYYILTFGISVIVIWIFRILETTVENCLPPKQKLNEANVI